MKGFVGGIPLALLVAAVQVQALEGQNNFHQRRTAGLEPHVGGTAMGGPSGNDGDGGFTSPYNAQVNAHSNVNEISSDDHSIKIHNKDIHAPPPPIPYGPALGPGAGPFGPALGPGAGPFPKRSWPAGGTAEGGPSGDDEGQVFNMPITANVKTDVSESTEDDHSIDVKNKDVHPPPVFVAPVHPPFAGPPGPGGPPSGFRTATGKASDHFHIPATEMAKRFGPAAGGTAMGGPGDGGYHHGAPGPFVPGGTAMGGPSGDDDDWTFNVPETANVHSSVDEHYKDDHSVDIKNKDIYPPPPFGVPFKRGLYPHAAGGTAMGGPSGNDGGQEFNMPITANIDTSVAEDHEDDHSIDLKHKDVYPAPPHFGGPHFPRAYSPSREGGSEDGYPPVAGGTAMGGPSGDDSDGGFNAPKSVDVDSNVNEDHEDNHAIKLDTTTVHPPSWNIPEHPVEEVHEVHEEVPQMPWMSYEEQQHHAANPAPPAPEPAPEGPPAHRDDHEEDTQCSAQIHEVVHTVTKTQYKEVQATKTVYQQVVSQAAQTSAVPMSAIPMQSGSAPKIMSSAVHSEVAYASSYAPYESYKYKSQSPMSSPAAVYSMIPVNVPMGSSSSYMYSMATPAPSHGANVPSGVSPEHSAMASASASPSSHSAMFTGAASRVSGGFVSAAAAVVGVLAFVL